MKLGNWRWVSRSGAFGRSPSEPDMPVSVSAYGRRLEPTGEYIRYRQHGQLLSLYVTWGFDSPWSFNFSVGLPLTYTLPIETRNCVPTRDVRNI